MYIKENILLSNLEYQLLYLNIWNFPSDFRISGHTGTVIFVVDVGHIFTKLDTTLLSQPLIFQIYCIHENKI
jgi:hypothetical protein